MRRLFYALPVMLAATPAAADLPPDVWFSPCSDPVATCVRPTATSTQKQSCGGCSSQPAADEPRRLYPIADATGELLDQWERASQEFYPVTEAERLRLRVERTDLTGQQLELVCTMKQPIRASDLVQRYHWSTLATQGEVATLVAVPKDRLERLFYDRFVVDLDTSTGRPAGLRFESGVIVGSAITSGGDPHPTIALRPWLDQSRFEVQLVGFESQDDQPRLLRTADVSDDISDDASRRLPLGPALLTPPPAPQTFDCREP